MIHYDMLHRGTGRLLEECPEAPWRPMFKFQFMRTEEPTGPTHDYSGTPATPSWPSSPLAPAWQATWEWLHGARPGSLPSGHLETPPHEAIFATGVNQETARVGEVLVLLIVPVVRVRLYTWLYSQTPSRSIFWTRYCTAPCRAM